MTATGWETSRLPWVKGNLQVALGYLEVTAGRDALGDINVLIYDVLKSWKISHIVDQFVPEAKISYLFGVSKNPFGDGLSKHRYRETVDGSEIPRPTTVWMYFQPFK